MDYREYPAPPALAPFVEAFWTLEARAAAGVGDGAAEREVAAARPAQIRPPEPLPDPEPVLPDGRVELIIHFADPFERFDEGTPTLQSDILVAGQLDAPLFLRPTGVVATLGVRMTPVGAWALLGIPQSELVGTTHSVGDLSRPLEELLREARDRAGAPEQAVPLIARGLLALVRHEAVDPRVAWVVGRLDGGDARTPIATLGAEVGLTARHLQRLFRDQVGLSPRTFGRVRRFQRAMAMIEGRGEGGVSGAGSDGGVGGASAIAHRAGYSDQSHFIREFRALAGTTPSAHALQRAELTGVFLEGAGRGAGPR